MITVAVTTMADGHTGLAAADAASAPCCSYSTAQYHIGSRPADPVLAPMLRWGSAAAHARQGAAGGSPHSLWLANEQQQRRQKHSIPYSARSGTSRPAPWPVFEAIKRGPTGGIRWQRTLYRFPQVGMDDGACASIMAMDRSAGLSCWNQKMVLGACMGRRWWCRPAAQMTPCVHATDAGAGS